MFMTQFNNPTIKLKNTFMILTLQW